MEMTIWCSIRANVIWLLRNATSVHMFLKKVSWNEVNKINLFINTFMQYSEFSLIDIFTWNILSLSMVSKPLVHPVPVPPPPPPNGGNGGCFLWMVAYIWCSFGWRWVLPLLPPPLLLLPVELLLPPFSMVQDLGISPYPIPFVCGGCSTLKYIKTFYKRNLVGDKCTKNT